MDASGSRSSYQEITDGLREWRLGVLEKEGLEEWRVRDGEPYCWTPIETVKVWTGSRPAIFLHEVAHALYRFTEGPLNNHYHGGQWAAEYGRLVDAYLEPRQPYPFSLWAWARGRLVSFARHVWWNSCRPRRRQRPGGGRMSWFLGTCMDVLSHCRALNSAHVRLLAKDLRRLFEAGYCAGRKSVLGSTVPGTAERSERLDALAMGRRQVMGALRRWEKAGGRHAKG